MSLLAPSLGSTSRWRKTAQREFPFRRHLQAHARTEPCVDVPQRLQLYPACRETTQMPQISQRDTRSAIIEFVYDQAPKTTGTRKVKAFDPDVRGISKGHQCASHHCKATKQREMTRRAFQITNYRLGLKEI